jgi:polysaccharide biosynthesis/export protein
MIRHYWTITFCLIGLFLGLSCSSSTPEFVDPQFDDGNFGVDATPYSAPVGEIKEDDFVRSYKGEHQIRGEDVLEIMVIGHADTQVESLPVSPDGYVYYLMAKPIYARGKTVGALKKALETNLQDFFVEPKVYVRVVERNQNSFQILGKVKSPGEYSLEIPLTLKEAVAISGGLQSGLYRNQRVNLASLSYSYLMREGKKLPIDFRELLEKGNEKYDVYMRPGDYVYIASAISMEVYVLGDIGEPHSVYYQDDLTVLKVLTAAGITKDAYLKDSLILRKSLKKPEVIHVNMKAMLAGKEKDIYLQPGDIIYVPEDPNKAYKDLVKLALRAFVQTFSSDAGLYFSDQRIYGNDN